MLYSALHYCCGQLDLVAAASITTAAPDLLESADEDGKKKKHIHKLFLLRGVCSSMKFDCFSSLAGLTPLHLAVIQGNAALVNLLIANKANVNAIDNEGHSVVHWAAGELDGIHAIVGLLHILRVSLSRQLICVFPFSKQKFLNFEIRCDMGISVRRS